MPESTSEEEEDASDAEAHLPGWDEAATGADSPLVYQETGDEDAPATLREARPAPGLLADPPLAGTERRSPTPVARQSSGAVAKDAAPLAPTKALKTGARAMPHSAPQPSPVVDIVAEAAKLREAMARGAQAAQQSRAPGNGGEASQSGAEAAAPADAVADADRGGADGAARPLPDSSEEFGDSRDIDPAAAASAADKVAKFMSSCADVLDEGTFEGPHHGAIIQSGVPPEYLHDERE
ncbi:skin secretory protein xP2-like [Panicum virgatum]|uniref:skin secretory protein xP2-like n=1 Tax=Panicum virgatum TaxID=38727 RepID=UPI0019D5F3C8|nr:skin secretory protein xP2-like [Panicum virgatum]